MGRLSPAYDTHSTKGLPTNGITDPLSTPMEVMGASILAKVSHVAGDVVLHRAVTSLGVPPQLYCTRWVRLMFAREVVGYRNVLDMWDGFFHLAAEEEAARRADEIADDNDEDEDVWLLASQRCFMDVMECAAASMILMVRDRLLRCQIQTAGTHAHEGIDVLMNYPPLKEARVLVDVVTTLIWQQRRDARACAPRYRKGVARVQQQPQQPHFAAGTLVCEATSTPRPNRSSSVSSIANVVRESVSNLSDALSTAAIGAIVDSQAAISETTAVTNTTSSTAVPRSYSGRATSSTATSAVTDAANTDLHSRQQTLMGGQRTNEELAVSLGTSVATIMHHLKETSLRATAAATANIDNRGMGGSDKEITVPQHVWEALLAINNVGNELLSREGE